MGVCVKDLSWHPDEETAPQELTGNSKRVRVRREGGGGGDLKRLGKHGGLSAEYLSSGARRREDAKMKFDFQLISRKCGATARGASAAADAEQAELPHETSEGSAQSGERAGIKGTFVQAGFEHSFARAHGPGCEQSGRKHVRARNDVK